MITKMERMFKAELPPKIYVDTPLGKLTLAKWANDRPSKDRYEVEYNGSITGEYGEIPVHIAVVFYPRHEFFAGESYDSIEDSILIQVKTAKVDYYINGVYKDTREHAYNADVKVNFSKDVEEDILDLINKKVASMNKGNTPTDLNLLADQIRALIMDEHEAIINYEEIIADSDDEDVNDVLREISREEKVHAKRLKELLLQLDSKIRE